MDFKFFQKPKPVGNIYLGFNMDDTLIAVLKYKQYHNLDIIGSNDIDMNWVGVPINNCWMRVLNWRTYETTLTGGDMIEIDYRVIEINLQGRDFTLRMEQREFLRRIEISQYR